VSSAVDQPLRAVSRSLKREQRRRKILRVALRVFTRPGKRKNDIEEIARRAGVGKATIYREFGSRDRLLEQVAKDGIEELLSRMVAAIQTTGEPEQLVGDAIRAALGFYDENPALARLILLESGESREPITADYMMQYERSRPAAFPIFEAHGKADALRDHDNEALVDVLMYLITGRLLYWVLTGQRTRLTDDADLLTHAYLGGVLGRREEA
jgi:AcrR family transcriptional regulator